MDLHTITIQIVPSDVNIGLVKKVAGSVVRALHIVEDVDSAETPLRHRGLMRSDAVVLTFKVMASGLNEALRTARAVEGSISPLAAHVSAGVD